MGLFIDFRKLIADALGRPLTAQEEKQAEQTLQEAWDEITGGTGVLEHSNDHIPLDEWNRRQLLSYAEGGVSRVAVISRRDGSACAVCAQADRTEYSVPEAIRLQPLPHADCSCEDGCECIYRPLGRN